MQNLVKLNRDLSHLKNPKRWLTRNRFWNLFFLISVPTNIYIAALMWSWSMLFVPLAITIAVFGFVPVDENTILPADARKNPFAKTASGIFFASVVAFGFAGSKILAIFGIELGQFGFGEVVFFIFLIPILILTYANIPLSSCVERTKAINIRKTSSNASSHTSPWSYQHTRDRYTNPSYAWMNGNVYKRD